MTWVLDSSVVIKWYLPENDRAHAVRLLDEKRYLVAPTLMIYEVSNIVWKKCRRGDVDDVSAEKIVNSVCHAPIHFLDGTRFAGRAWRFARQLEHPAYDCFYLACAEAFDGTVVTADERFLAALRDSGLAGRGRHVADV